MKGAQFVAEMETTLWQILSVRDVALSHLAETAGRADMGALLRGALRNEMEASEIAARWMPETDDLEAKLAFARQAGDEARHFQLITRRLVDLGADAADASIVADERSRLYRYLESLRTTLERIAAAQFTREAIGYKSNELFIAYCDACGDSETAKMYREAIQPDERHHHLWGKDLIARLASGEAEQVNARKAILTTLELAEELRSLAAGRLLVETPPGC